METSGLAKTTGLKNSCQLQCPEQDQPSRNPSINREGASQDPPLTEALLTVDG